MGQSLWPTIQCMIVCDPMIVLANKGWVTKKRQSGRFYPDPIRVWTPREIVYLLESFSDVGIGGDF